MRMAGAPCGHFAAEFDAGGTRWGWVLAGPTEAATLGWHDLGVSDEVDAGVADHGHVDGAVALAEAGLVFLEDNVEHPVQRILDGPMSPNGFGGFQGREGGGGDVVARVEAAALLEFGLPLDLDHGGNTGQTEFAGEAAVAVQPIDLVRHRDGALLDATVSLVGVIGAVAFDLGVGEQGLDLVARVGWLAFTARR